MMSRVQELCRKLKPVLGTKTDRLWAAYLAESENSGRAEIFTVRGCPARQVDLWSARPVSIHPEEWPVERASPDIGPEWIRKDELYVCPPPWNYEERNQGSCP